MDDVTRLYDGRPMFYQDAAGLIHACDSAMATSGKPIAWTLCNRDVPANGAFTADKDISVAVTCEKCREMQARSNAGG
jgi:hypothetical protein